MIASTVGCSKPFARIPNSGSNNIFILNKSEESIKAYDKVIEINPQDGNAWKNKRN